MAGFDFAPGRARLGVHVSSMTPELRKFLGAKQDAGILVQRVDPDTPAAKAGIRVGDIVVSVDGDAIDEIDDVASALADHGAGEKVEVVVVRKKARKRLRIAMQDDASARGFAMPEGVFSFGHGAGQEIEILRKTIDALEKRVDELDRSRRRASKPKD
jgi:predicted metalloprotease with PDZ domain